MDTLWISWAVVFAVIVAIVLVAGWAAKRRLFGALVDSRGRYSLSRLQILLWTATIVSMTGGVFVARLLTRELDPSAFTIPPTVLGLMGVAGTSSVLATAVKAYKDSTRAAWVAASPDGAASPAQLILVEEGPDADRLVDVAKLQSLVVTVLLVVAYVGLGIYQFGGYGTVPVHGPGDIRSLPEISGALLTLLAISNATYLGGKLPNRGTTMDERPGYSLLDRMSTVGPTARREQAADNVAGDRRAQRRLARQRRQAAVAEQARIADEAAAATRVAAATTPPPPIAAPMLPSPLAVEPFVGRAQVRGDTGDNGDRPTDEHTPNPFS
jgi:hypothetical protein